MSLASNIDFPDQFPSFDMQSLLAELPSLSTFNTTTMLSPGREWLNSKSTNFAVRPCFRLWSFETEKSTGGKRRCSTRSNEASRRHSRPWDRQFGTRVVEYGSGSCSFLQEADLGQYLDASRDRVFEGDLGSRDDSGSGDGFGRCGV